MGTSIISIFNEYSLRVLQCAIVKVQCCAIVGIAMGSSAAIVAVGSSTVPLAPPAPALCIAINDKLITQQLSNEFLIESISVVSILSLLVLLVVPFCSREPPTPSTIPQLLQQVLLNGQIFFTHWPLWVQTGWVVKVKITLRDETACLISAKLQKALSAFCSIPVCSSQLDSTRILI